MYISMASAIIIMLGGVAKFGITSPYITTFSASAILLPNLVLAVASLVTRKLEDSHVAYIFDSKKIEEAE